MLEPLHTKTTFEYGMGYAIDPSDLSDVITFFRNRKVTETVEWPQTIWKIILKWLFSLFYILSRINIWSLMKFCWCQQIFQILKPLYLTNKVIHDFIQRLNVFDQSLMMISFVEGNSFWIAFDHEEFDLENSNFENITLTLLSPQ